MPHAIRLTLCVLWLVVVSLPALATTPHTFSLDTRQWVDQPRTVHVAGAFNGWSKDATPMHRDAQGVYRATLDLTDGVHHYKFIIDGERWVNDPVHSDATLEASDGHGGVNSAVFIGFDARALPPPRPNHLNTEALRHNIASDFRVVSSGQMVMIEARAQTGDAQQVQLEMRKADQSTRRVSLPRVESQLGWDHFAVLAEVSGERLTYRLVFVDGSAVEELPWIERDLVTDFETPDWAKDAVWYQVFPERFRNGDPSNDPGDAWFENLLPWTADWWATHTEHGEKPGEVNFHRGHGNVWKRRFGGDIQGVQQKLPYLRRLGVNALYFNPVFEADSIHKYDTSDFRHIDDNFGVKGDLPITGETEDPQTWQWSGSDKVFLDFIEEAHRQGFKVVIDGVFNHVGRSHPFFMDVLMRGRESRFADWFEITDWGNEAADHAWGPDTTIDDLMKVHGRPGGIQWRAWDGDNGHLPTFQKDEKLGLAPGPRQHIFDITTRWLAPDGEPRKGVDGFRLDVPGDIPHPFWIAWRKHVKTIKPDAYITGEIWSFAHPWLEGDQFDATMNYPFAIAGHEFFINQQMAIPPSRFARRLMEVAYAYPLQVALVQMNLYDSHDTDRLASMFVNPDRPYDGLNRLQDSGPNYDPRRPNETEWQRMKQAVTLKMTFLGAPMIYYGNEAGMWGPDDPSNRKPMLWQDLEPYQQEGMTFNQGVFDHHQRLIAARHALLPLRRGYFRVIHTDDDAGVIAFERYLSDRRVYAVFNRSPEARRVTLKLDGTPAAVRLIDVLDPRTAAIHFDEDGAADARPTLHIADQPPTFTAENGRVMLTLPPYGSAVLIDADQLP